MVSSIAKSRRLPSSVGARVRTVLRRHASRITVEAAMESTLRRLGKTEQDLEREGITETVATTAVRSLAIYLKTAQQRLACRQELMRLADGRPAAGGRAPNPTPALATVKITIANEVDVVRARRDARALADKLGLDRASTIKVATAVSELARNIFAYVGTGTIELGPAPGRRVGIRIVAEDRGPGIRNLDDILDGNYRSKTGMGLGLRGSRNIMDSFEIESNPGRGTRIEMVKYRF